MIHLSRKPLAAVRELAAIVLLGVAAACASAQTGWPNKPVRIVVPYGAGSSPDVMARLMGDRLSARLGQPVLVENRAGAGGNTGTGAVAKSAADGYTYVISTNGPLVYNTVLAMPQVRQVMLASFMEPLGGSTQDLARFLQTELRVMTPVIRRTGIKAG